MDHLAFGAYLFHAWPTPETTTDQAGRFTLRGLAKARAYILVADPDEGTAHLHRFGYVPDTIGSDPVTATIDLPRGVVVTGRITDPITAAGVQCRVFYRPLEKNALLGQFGGYGPPDLPAPWHRGRDTSSDADGRYKITVMPGAGVVHIQAHDRTKYELARASQQDFDDGIVDRRMGHFRTVGQGGMYNPEYMNAFKVINPAPSERTATLDVVLRRAAPAAKPRPDSPAPSKAKGKSPAAGVEPAATGRVLAPDGKPLAGAKLLLIGKGDKPVDLGTTAADGRFAVKVPKDRAGAYLIARADGVGIDFIDLAQADPKTPIELRTVADQVIRGRLIDTEGKPVVGAWVRVDRLGTSRENSLAPILVEWKKLDVFSASPAGAKQIWGGAGALWTATTDKDGRFEFRNVGAERLAVLRLGGAGVTELEAYVATRMGLDPKEYNKAVVKNARAGFGSGKPRWQLYGPDCGVVVEREKLIRGQVTELGTGKPRPGVHVILSRSGSDLLPVPLGAWTDKDGRYELHGAHKSNRYMVEVSSNPADGFMACQVWAEDSTGYDPLTINLGVKKGIVVTGRMLDRDTGKPVAGFVMIGVPQGNPFLKDYPKFDSSAWFPIQSTDAEGRFRTVAIPGPVLLMGGPNTQEGQGRYNRPAADPKYPQFFKVFGDHTAYYMPGGAISPLQGNFCKVLEIKPDAKSVEADILLTPVEAKNAGK
jgi:hypothetical protein